jgi:hypothetical protein
MDTPHCPLCGVCHPEPVAITRSTSWDDGCACSDNNRCVNHRLHGGGPSRPSDEALLQRAIARAARDHARWETLIRQFDRFQAWLAEHPEP